VGLHQFTRVGRLAMLSALSAVNKDVPPYMLCGGRPAVIQGLNVIGMRRAGFAAPVREEIKHAYKLLYRSGLNVGNAMEAIKRECKSAEVAHLVAFVEASKRGICAGIAGSAAAGGSEEDPSEGESILPRKTLRTP
jgi:UDP-N-acetylglucosamine acyltransferase